MLTTFAGAFPALYVGHHLGDYWVQTDHDARHKGGPGWPARIACARHVATLTATQGLALAALAAVDKDFRPSARQVAAGLAVNAVSHYWADRRTTLAALAALVPGKAQFYALGAPRPGRDDNPTLGTGAAHLDQSWHMGWLFIAALIVAAEGKSRGTSR